MRDAVIGTDRDGKIQVMNGAAEALTGWPANAAAGRALGEVFRIDGRSLLTRDQRAVRIEGRAEGIRDASGALEGIRLHFSPRDAA
jgi:PAS domain-containing protein